MSEVLGCIDRLPAAAAEVLAAEGAGLAALLGRAMVLPPVLEDVIDLRGRVAPPLFAVLLFYIENN